MTKACSTPEFGKNAYFNVLEWNLRLSETVRSKGERAPAPWRETQIDTMHSKGLRVLRTDMSFEVLTIVPGTWSFTSGQLASKYDGVTRTFSPKRPHEDPDMGNSLGGKAQSSPRDAPRLTWSRGGRIPKWRLLPPPPTQLRPRKETGEACP